MNWRSAAMVLLSCGFLAGCSSGGSDAAREASGDLSLDDSCRTFLDASHNTKGRYYTMACGYMVMRRTLAMHDNEPYPGMFRRCIPGSQSYVAGSLQDTMQSYCEQDPPRPLKHALDFHWAKSVKRDSFY